MTLEDVLGSPTNIVVLRYLISLRQPLSGNAIARQLGLHQSSARLALERLVEAGAVTRLDIGRSAGYALADDREFIQQVIAPLFVREQAFYDGLKANLVRAIESIRPAPLAVFLFGSVARGARDFRDIDLLYVVSDSIDKNAVHEHLAEAFENISERYATPVSPVVTTVKDLDSAPMQSITAAVKHEGLLLWGTAPAQLATIRHWSPTR